jgi:hypothetical protein
MVYLASEGHTEVDYYSMNVFKNLRLYQVKPLRNKRNDHSTPTQTLKLAREEESKSRLRKDDEIWLLIDVDAWKAEDIEEAIRWANEGEHRRLAISNPKFELFLLLHFEEGKGCTTDAVVDRRLKNYWSDYDKHVPASKFNAGSVKKAILHSKERRSGSKPMPPNGSTDAYLLAEQLLA